MNHMAFYDPFTRIPDRCSKDDGNKNDKRRVDTRHQPPEEQLLTTECYHICLDLVIFYFIPQLQGAYLSKFYVS